MKPTTNSAVLSRTQRRIVIGVCIALGTWYGAFAALIVIATLAGPSD
jgi:hypothetical protein